MSKPEFHNFLPDIESVRGRIVFRIKELMSTLNGTTRKSIHYGPADSLAVTTSEGTKKVTQVAYMYGRNQIFVYVEGVEKELFISDLSSDDVNAIYENVYENIVNSN